MRRDRRWVTQAYVDFRSSSVESCGILPMTGTKRPYTMRLGRV